MIIAATGHRPDKLGGYTDAVSHRLGSVASRWLEDQDPQDLEYVISGMALGWDQAVAHACVQLGIPFHAYIPFKGQEGRWPTHARHHYEFLLSMAAEVKVISGAGYQGWKMQKRNEAMVDRCTHVLALWNGSTGGTANCIIYAELRKRPIINLWSRFVGQS